MPTLHANLGGTSTDLTSNTFLYPKTPYRTLLSATYLGSVGQAWDPSEASWLGVTGVGSGTALRKVVAQLEP